MHVMAAALLDPRGRVLLAQRPPGKHLAGLWEFPGGKLEPGETPWMALVRELREEIGITLLRAEPLIRVPCHDSSRDLVLDTWRGEHWEGQPQSLEGQALQWVLPAQVDPTILARGDRAILQALRLPTRCAITPADIPPEQTDRWFQRIGRAIECGPQLVQLRLPLWPRQQMREFAANLLPPSRRDGSPLLLHGDIEGARMLGIGVQLDRHDLHVLSERPLPLSQLVGADCHDASDLAQAGRLGVDFAILAPAVSTAGAVQGTAWDWASFQLLAEAAALPVYARGGLATAHVTEARANSGQGVAGSRDFWC